MENQYKHLQIKIKKRLSGDFHGSFKSAFKGLGVEFDSLREYIPGDSIKSIDWKTTAKLGDVHVKNYEEEKDINVLFIIEDSESLDFGSEIVTKRQTLEEIFFLLAQSSLTNGLKIGSLIHSYTDSGVSAEFIDFKRGEENIIRTLTSLEQEDNSSAKKSILKNKSLIKHLNIKNSLIFILTDSLTMQQSDLKYLNALNELVVVNVSDYFEDNLSDDAFEFSVTGPRFFSFGQFFTGNKQKIQDYRKETEQEKALQKKFLKQQRMEYIHLDNRDDMFVKFYNFFNSYPHL